MKPLIILLPIIALTACHAIPKQSPMPFIAPNVDTVNIASPTQNPQSPKPPTSKQKHQKPKKVFLLEDWF